MKSNPSDKFTATAMLSKCSGETSGCATFSVSPADLTEPDLIYLGYAVKYFREGRGCVVWDEGEHWIGVGADAVETLRAAVAAMFPSHLARVVVEAMLAERHAENLTAGPGAAAMIAVVAATPTHLVSTAQPTLSVELDPGSVATDTGPVAVEPEPSLLVTPAQAQHSAGLDLDSVTVDVSAADAEPETIGLDAALAVLDSNPADVSPEAVPTALVTATTFDVQAAIEEVDAIEKAVTAGESELAVDGDVGPLFKGRRCQETPGNSSIFRLQDESSQEAPQLGSEGRKGRGTTIGSVPSRTDHMTKNALKKTPTEQNASHAPLDSVPLRGDEDAASAILPSVVLGAPMVHAQTAPRRAAAMGTPPGPLHLFCRQQCERNATWGVQTMSLAMSVFGEGKPAENPSVRVAHVLRFTIIVDWQDATAPSIAEAPELASVLQKRSLPIVGKAVFSDRKRDDEVVEVLFVDADKAATEEIREAVSRIGARRMVAAAGTATSAKYNEGRSRAFRDRLVAEGVIPNAEAIATIWADDGIAVLFFEAARGPEEIKFGFTGPVGRMSEQVRDSLRRCDHVTARWCEDKPGVCRLFVVAHEGTLLVNFTDGKYSIEPGSLGFGWSN